MPARKIGGCVAELERLQTKVPWWQTAFLRLGGTFDDAQWQSAAGSDMYVLVESQAQAPEFYDAAFGALPDRVYTRLQVQGLLSWILHVRLREEPKERFTVLFSEMMEHVWNSFTLDLARGEHKMGFIEISKHLKAAQYSWHGCCKALDAALLSDSPREEIAAVLLRNLYTDEEGDPLVGEDGQVEPEIERAAAWCVEYVLAQRVHLAGIDADDVLMGRVTWAPSPQGSKSSE